MKPFAFRQRVGHVNWKAITSVDIETVVDDNQIEELQSIVDDVTFCEIKSADIVFGEWDIVSLIEVKTTEDLGKFVMDKIRDIPEVKLTSTMILWSH